MQNATPRARPRVFRRDRAIDRSRVARRDRSIAFRASRSTGQNPRPARSIAARALNCPHSSSSTSFDAIRSRREREIDETDTFRVVERAPWLDSRVARDMNADEMIADGDANGVDVRALDEAMAMDDDHASARKSASSAPANANPPLPPNARPRHEGRGGANGHGGERRRGGGERGGGRGGGRFLPGRDRGGSRPGRWTSTAEGPRTADSARGAG